MDVAVPAKCKRVCLSIAFSWLLCLFGIPLHGQFFLNGEAMQLNDTCFQLTEDRLFNSGSIWDGTKINLLQSFDVVIEVNLGCRDADGADGMVFGFQPLNTSIGGQGEGIGFQGIVPSLGIELDTWQNENLSDPTYDHMAIIRDGNLDHNTNRTLAGPVTISAASQNVEDCRFHTLRVVWDAEAMILETYFDCEQRLSYVGDIVNDIFDGDPEVYWGVTSATGGAFNIHQVCFTYTTFLDQLEDITMCPDGQVNLSVRGGSSYLWEPAEGLSDPTIADPVASPEETTTYTVRIREACGAEFVDSLTVFVEGQPLPLDLGPDQSLCEGDQVQLDVTTPQATYLWNDGSTEGIRALERGGIYEVTVTRTDIYCIATDEILITEVVDPLVDFQAEDTSGCPGQTLVLLPRIQGGIPTWSDGTQGESFEVRSEGPVSATIENVCGVATDMVQVSFAPCDDLYVPGAFSPNGDGVNDSFTVYGDSDIERVETLQVFDRWGGLLFSVSDFLPGDGAPAWDGRIRNRNAPVGTYLYQVKVHFRDGSSQVRSGELVLLR